MSNLNSTAQLPRVLTRAQVIDAGGSDDAIRWALGRRRWCRMAPGLYLTRPPATFHDRLLAATLHAGDTALVSGAACLRASGFRSVKEPVRILVLVRRDVGVRSTPTIQVRRTRRLPEPAPGPVAMAPIARAVADHALRLDYLGDVRAVVAESIQQGHCELADLQLELDRGGRNGSAHFRKALDEVACGARSGPEAEAGTVLREAGLLGFRQNAELTVEGRRFVADFLWEDLMAILEIDSEEFHFRREDWLATMRRHATLEAAGYSVIHIPPSALRDRAGFLDTVAKWLAGRRRSLLAS
jgi:very-short-patch-repair endonuclease